MTGRLLAVLTVAAVAAGCSGGGSAPPKSAAATVTISGTLLTNDVAGALHDCSPPQFDRLPGAELDVTSGAGTVVAVGHLSTAATVAPDPSSGGFNGCSYTFSVTAVPVQPVYGFQVVGKQLDAHVTDVSRPVGLYLRG